MKFTEYVPYDAAGIGYACNLCAEHCPTEWVAFRDSDVMLLGNYGHLIETVIAEQGAQFDLFTCVTNRITVPHQQAMREVMRERDLLRLYELQQRLFAEHGTRVDSVEQPIAGFFMLFRKSLWREIQFPAESADPLQSSPKFLGIDVGWTSRVLATGRKIGVIRGLLAIHYYRMHTSAVNHHWRRDLLTFLGLRPRDAEQTHAGHLLPENYLFKKS